MLILGYVPTKVTTPEEASIKSRVFIFWFLFSTRFGNWPGSVEKIVADSSEGKPPFDTDIFARINFDCFYILLFYGHLCLSTYLIITSYVIIF